MCFRVCSVLARLQRLGDLFSCVYAGQGYRVKKAFTFEQKSFKVGASLPVGHRAVLGKDDVWKANHLEKSGGLKGGLAVGTILLMVVISAMNGLSVAGMAIGATIALPEMLKRGYLAAASVYVSYAHNENIVDEYLKAVDECFLILSNAIHDNNENKILETKVRSDSFNRITP